MRNKKNLLNAWKQLKMEIQYDMSILDLQIQTLRDEIIGFIDEPDLPEYLQNKIAAYNEARSERKSLSRLIKILIRNIRGAEMK